MLDLVQEMYQNYTCNGNASSWDPLLYGITDMVIKSE